MKAYFDKNLWSIKFSLYNIWALTQHCYLCLLFSNVKSRPEEKQKAWSWSRICTLWLNMQRKWVLHHGKQLYMKTLTPWGVPFPIQVPSLYMYCGRHWQNRLSPQNASATHSWSSRHSSSTAEYNTLSNTVTWAGCHLFLAETVWKGIINAWVLLITWDD